MSNVRVTKKDNFRRIAEVLQAQGLTELVEVMNHEIELLEKKATSSKATKNQVANEGIKELIVAEMARIAEPVTITELLAKSAEIAEKCNGSNQKLSALMKQLKDTNVVIRTQDKKVARFSLAE